MSLDHDVTLAEGDTFVLTINDSSRRGFVSITENLGKENERTMNVTLPRGHDRLVLSTGVIAGDRPSHLRDLALVMIGAALGLLLGLTQY